MPNPTQGDVHVNRPLTNMAMTYMQNANAFVADKVFPNLPVQKQSDLYWLLDRADWNRNQFRKRADSTESAGSGWKQSTTPYFCDVWGLHKDIGDQTRANYDNFMTPDRAAVAWLTNQAMICREVTFVSKFFTTGLWTGISGSAADVTGVAASPSTNEVLQWNDANSNPIEDVETYRINQLKLSFRKPNTAVMGVEVWAKIKNHSDFIERIKYSSTNTTPALVLRQALAALWELDNVYVMESVQVTSAENPAFETSKTAAFIGGKAMLLAYVNPTPSIDDPSAGYTFSWAGYRNGLAGPAGQVIRTFRLEAKSTDRVECEMAYDQKITGTDLGTFFASIVA